VVQDLLDHVHVLVFLAVLLVFIFSGVSVLGGFINVLVLNLRFRLLECSGLLLAGLFSGAGGRGRDLGVRGLVVANGCSARS